MRTGHVQASRPEWYDRTPVMIDEVYIADAVAPHAITVRWTYTVPAGKKATVERTLARQLRQTAAGAIGTYACSVLTVRSTVDQAQLITLRSIDNAVGAVQNDNIGGGIIMQAADTIEGRTIDGSTGGTVDYRVSLKATEFDA